MGLNKLAIILGALAISAGCTLLNPLGTYDEDPTEADASDASRPVGETDALTDGGCARTLPPARPLSNGTEGEGSIDFVNALRTLDIGDESDAGLVVSPSYDLDGVCTCPGAGSCVPVGGAMTRCDQPGGGDNAGSELFASLAVFPGVDQATTAVTPYILTGEYGMLFELSRYNGGPDDTSVTLSYFVSNGTPEDDGGTRAIPKFDGNDVWTVDPSAVGTTTIPYFAKAFDLDAYVSGGTLVATVPEGFPMRVGSLTMNLTAARLTARIVNEGGAHFHLEEGRFFGRWPSGALLTSLSVLRDPTGQTANPGLCGDSGAYQTIKVLVCNRGYLDVNVNPAADNTGAPCTAAAVSLRFSTSMASFGPLVSPAPKIQRDCPGAWEDDCRL